MKWLERAVIAGPYLTYCDSEEEFKEILKHLEFKHEVPEWSNPTGGRMHTFTAPGKMPTCVVCVTPEIYKRELGAAIGLLIHEATHVWQVLREELNETKPSHEFEATSIQIISSNLIWEFLERKKARRKTKAK